MELLIDTHAHLYDKRFATDEAEMIARARSVAQYVMLPGIDRESIVPLKELAARYPDFLKPMAGLHPCSVKEDYLDELAAAEQELATGACIAVGECGIDLYWDKTTLPLQKTALQMQIDWAKNLNLPIILHSREAFAETIQLMEAGQDGRLRGIFHCFAGTLTDAKRAVDVGFLLGIGGVFTYKKNGGLDDVVRAVPRESLVLETDAPYLTPLPHRGQRNESSYMQLVAQRLAEVLGTTYDDVAQFTSRNARRVFALPE